MLDELRGVVTGTEPETIARFHDPQARMHVLKGDDILERDSYKFADDITKRIRTSPGSPNTPRG